MGVKFFIATEFTSERTYCKSVCKLIDNTLTDDDFYAPSLASGFSYQSLADYYTANFANLSPKPIIFIPENLRGAAGRTTLEQVYHMYPDIPFVSAYYIQQALPDLPADIALDPDRLQNIVLCSGGVSGVSDWYTGPGLEFVDECPVQYLSGVTNVLDFPITNVTSPGGGVARIFTSQLHNYVSAKMRLHISGVGGFANDLNGIRAVTAVNTGSGYVDVTFDLGAGTFSGASAKVVVQWISGAICNVAVKLSQIMRERECGFWEARYCARQTASEGGVHDEAKGYGEIDADAAIAYSGSVISDPFDTIGSIGTLEIDVTDGVATFTHPEIVNAHSAKLYRGNDVIREIGNIASNGLVMLGKELTLTHHPIKLGNHAYKLKGFRSNQSTAFSNTVNTNITSLADMPSDPVYPVGFTGYYWQGTTLKSSAIVSISLFVHNPENNNVGEEKKMYNLADGSSIPEDRLYASGRDAQAALRPGVYLNPHAPLILDVFAYDTDLCGLNYQGTDFTDGGDYDFTDAIVSRTNFTGATLPAAFTGGGGLAAFLAAVAFCNPVTTIWTTGNTVAEELES